MKLISAAVMIFIAITSSPAVAQERTTKLNEVIVTATKTEKDPNDVTQPVSVISGEEIRKSGATNVATAVQNATSVYIDSYGTPGSVQSVSIRGAASAQVLVLVDGIRMNSPRDGGFDLSLIPVSIDDIDRIEVLRGPGSALYGSDAMGGVINVITKKPTATQNTIKVTAGNNRYGDIFLGNSGRNDQVYYSMSGNYVTSDGYRENSDLDQWVYGGKLGYDISRTSSVEVSANFLNNEVGSPGSTIFGLTPNARQKDDNSVLAALFKTDISTALNLKLSWYSKRDILSFKDPDTIDMITLQPEPTDNRYDTRSEGGEAQLSWLIADWNQLTMGYDLRKDRLDSSDAQNGSANHSESLYAYYLQDEISIGEPLIIVIGGREDHHSVYGKKSSPKASARYYIKSTGTIIRASYGKSFRAPTFNDLYFNTTWAVGNPNLKPESAEEYEGGIEQKLGNDAFLKFAAFDRKVKDLIQWDWLVFPMQVNNIGRAHIRGYEAEAGYDLANALFASINYTYTNPVDETTGAKLYTIPESVIKGILTYYPEKSVYVTLQGRAVHYYAVPGASARRYEVMDIRSADKIWKTGEFFVSITNIFKRNYEVVPGYPMPSREVFTGISYQF
jgi:outer membrane cobalamin receptor